jgi:hypothetical protein
MARLSPRLVVGAFAGVRVVIGVAFAVAPRRLSGPATGASPAALMTRSFAVREAVLGVGGLVAAARPQTSPAAVRAWAGLGALTDAGDLAASLAGGPSERSAVGPALLAAGGLAAELWAFFASAA